MRKFNDKMSLGFEPIIKSKNIDSVNPQQNVVVPTKQTVLSPNNSFVKNVPSSNNQPILSPNNQPISYPNNQPISYSNNQPILSPKIVSYPNNQSITSPNNQPISSPKIVPSSNNQPILSPILSPNNQPISSPKIISSPNNQPISSPKIVPSPIKQPIPKNNPINSSSQPIQQNTILEDLALLKNSFSALIKNSMAITTEINELKKGQSKILSELATIKDKQDKNSHIFNTQFQSIVIELKSLQQYLKTTDKSSSEIIHPKVEQHTEPTVKNNNEPISNIMKSIFVLEDRITQKINDGFVGLNSFQVSSHNEIMKQISVENNSDKKFGGTNSLGNMMESFITSFGEKMDQYDKNDSDMNLDAFLSGIHAGQVAISGHDSNFDGLFISEMIQPQKPYDGNNDSVKIEQLSDDPSPQVSLISIDPILINSNPSNLSDSESTDEMFTGISSKSEVIDKKEDSNFVIFEPANEEEKLPEINFNSTIPELIDEKTNSTFTESDFEDLFNI